jgi:hypothetical protein
MTRITAETGIFISSSPPFSPYLKTEPVINDETAFWERDQIKYVPKKDPLAYQLDVVQAPKQQKLKAATDARIATQNVTRQGPQNAARKGTQNATRKGTQNATRKGTQNANRKGTQNAKGLRGNAKGNALVCMNV